MFNGLVEEGRVDDQFEALLVHDMDTDTHAVASTSVASDGVLEHPPAHGQGIVRQGVKRPLENDELPDAPVVQPLVAIHPFVENQLLPPMQPPLGQPPAGHGGSDAFGQHVLVALQVPHHAVLHIVSPLTIKAILRRTYLPGIVNPLLSYASDWLAHCVGRYDAMNEAHRDMDSATSQLVDVLYGKGPMSSMTTEGMCKQTGLKRRQALPREIRLASAMLLAMQHEQREFEMSLKSSAEAGDLRLLLYIDSAAMDETPMPV